MMGMAAAWVLTTASLAGIPTADEWITYFTGGPLYPSQLGAPGFPGMVTNQAAPEPWGFAEHIPYTGSVEHVRVQLQRYTPVVPVYNARTLIRNFPAVDLPGISKNRIRDYAEPIYSVPKYDDPKPTGQFNKPVRVVAWDKNSPPIELALGTFEPGTYVIGIIAATPTENVERMTKRLVINCEINDGPAGEVNLYRKRCAAIDEFYSIVEFFFHAPASRAYKVKLWIDPSTVLPVVLLHNIEAHNKLAQVAGKAGKKSATFYDPVQRLAGWKEKGTYKPDARTPEERLADDRKLWEACLPLNAEPVGAGDGQGAWYAFAGGADCLVPQGGKDDGMGIDFYGKDMFWNRSPAELAALLSTNNPRAWIPKGTMELMKSYPNLTNELTRHTAYVKAGWASVDGQPRLLNALVRAFDAIALAKQYHETGDETKARQAAILLARLGLQNSSHGSRQTMRAYDMIPALIHGDAAFRRRYKEMEYDSRGAFDVEGFVASYDQLFPYIQNNAELATALGRFIPWIKTPADAQRFYETYVLQYYAHQLMTYNAFINNGTIGWMANVMAIQQDPSIVKPWAEWLFRYAWDYPSRPMGVDEIAVNSITRDGTDKKGSTFYTWGGSELSTVLACLEICQKAGLKLPVDMSNPDQFPKAYWGKRFKEDISVAGGYAFYIGDVSGPNRERLKDLGPALRKTPDKIPNNPSRVLSTWAGILETGRDYSDFRQRRAVGVRVGVGYGHAHDDPFDLQIWAQGVPMCGDGGARNGYAEPNTGGLGNHNTVVSDVPIGRHQWISSFAPIVGAQYLKASLLCAGLYERQIVLVDADAANSYVVDVFRIKGGASPAYAFHGMPADQFEVNATDKHKAVLDQFLPEASKWSGACPETLTATWRMRRDPETVTWTNKAGVAGSLAVPGAERMAMGEDFDDKASRKFIRMHLPGHAGDEAYGARALCLQGTPYTTENLYVKPKDWKGEAVFVAVFEPFAGEGFVKSVRLLTPAASLASATAPVAVEVTLRDGRRDVVYLAMRDTGPTTAGGVTVQGEFGLVSFDAKGVQQAVLAGGTRLEAKGMTLTTEKAAYEGTIKSIDYFKRTATLSQPLPPEAAGAEIEVGKPPYPTSCTLAKAGGTDVTFLKGMDFAMSRVVEFSTNGLPVLQSAITVIPGMTVTDDGYKTFWRFAPDAGAGNLALVGAPAPKDVLKPGDTVRVWEVGPGDAYRLPVQIKVVRQADGKYQATGNAAATVKSGE
jgi:hypothetical protein